MFECREETFSEARSDIEKLLAEHWEEIALNKDKIKLKPDWFGYEQMYMMGRLCIVTARDKGVVVGYAVFILMRHLHYSSNVYALNDVLFLKKSHRKGTAGFRLLRAAEQILRDKGVSKINWHVKVHHDFGVLLKRLGYQLEETVWGKCVGE